MRRFILRSLTTLHRRATNKTTLTGARFFREIPNSPINNSNLPQLKLTQAPRVQSSYGQVYNEFKRSPCNRSNLFDSIARSQKNSANSKRLMLCFSIGILAYAGVNYTHADEKQTSALNFCRAVSSGNLAEVKQLYEDTRVNLSFTDFQDLQGYSLLHLAVISKNVEVVRFVLDELKVDVNTISIKNGQTALFGAVSNNLTDIVALLIERGINEGHIDKQGQTAYVFSDPESSILFYASMASI